MLRSHQDLFCQTELCFVQLNSTGGRRLVNMMPLANYERAARTDGSVPKPETAVIDRLDEGWVGLLGSCGQVSGVRAA
jgi:hypothetical protein